MRRLAGITTDAIMVATALALAGCSGQDIPDAEAASVSADGLSSTFMEAVARDVEGLAGKVVSLAEAMSEEQYTWRPGDGVLSAGEVFMHIAAYNYYYPSTAGAPIPDGVGVTTDYSTVAAFEESRSEKDDVLEALRASFDHLGTAVDEAAGADLEAEVEVFGSASTVQEAWFGTVTHIHEHLGQLIAYARTNGVTPPWSM